jgi:sensor domain CHASE-containing protein
MELLSAFSEIESATLLENFELVALAMIKSRRTFASTFETLAVI